MQTIPKYAEETIHLHIVILMDRNNAANENHLIVLALILSTCLLDF